MHFYMAMRRYREKNYLYIPIPIYIQGVKKKTKHAL